MILRKTEPKSPRALMRTVKGMLANTGMAARRMRQLMHTILFSSMFPTYLWVSAEPVKVKGVLFREMIVQ